MLRAAIMGLLAHFTEHARFTILPIYPTNGLETIHAAPYVALGLAALSFVWVSICLLRGRAWGEAVASTLTLVSFAGFAYACSWFVSSGAQVGYNVAHGLGLMVNAGLVAALVRYYRLGMNGRNVNVSEVSAKL